MPFLKRFFSPAIGFALASLLALVQCQAQPGDEIPLPTVVPTAAVLQTASTPIPSPIPLVIGTLPLPPVTVTPVTPTATPQPTSETTGPITTTLTMTSTIESGSVVRDLGLSSNGYPIQAFQMGGGSRHLMIVGGIHGGYEWNSILLAYELWDYFAAQPDRLPANVRLTVVPALNLDGQVVVTGTWGRFTPANVGADITIGRLNGRSVDLNRNWPCNWQPTGIWRQQPVSGGKEPFSEIENQHLNYFITLEKPDLVIFLHSALPGVIISSCNDVEADMARALANEYAAASGYPLYDYFAAYEVTGDAGDYLASMGIASFTVELTDHFNLELDRNINGMLQVMAALTHTP